MNPIDLQVVYLTVAILAGAWAVVMRAKRVWQITWRTVSAVFNYITAFVTMPMAVKRIDNETRYNGGSSIKDIQRRQTGQLVVLAQQMMVIADRVGSQGWFETDEQGRFVRTSLGYNNLVGRSTEETLGANWINSVWDDDREWVVDDWLQAVEHQRTYESSFKMVKDGVPFEVHCRAYPMRNEEGRVQGWFGILTRRHRRINDPPCGPPPHAPSP